MGSGRFDRLERGRAATEARPGAEAAAPSPGPGVAARFAGAPSPAESQAPARSGAAEARFEEGPSPAALKTLDLGDGQVFVRCARCRGDSYLSASHCAHCDADLETAEQRAFNQALWLRLRSEREEQEREVKTFLERRAGADGDRAEAFRQLAWLEAELARRQALGLPLDDRDDVSDPLRAGARWLRQAVSSLVGRCLPRAWRR